MFVMLPPAYILNFNINHLPIYYDKEIQLNFMESQSNSTPSVNLTHEEILGLIMSRGMNTIYTVLDNVLTKPP